MRQGHRQCCLATAIAPRLSGHSRYPFFRLSRYPTPIRIYIVTPLPSATTLPYCPYCSLTPPLPLPLPVGAFSGPCPSRQRLPIRQWLLPALPLLQALTPGPLPPGPLHQAPTLPAAETWRAGCGQVAVGAALETGEREVVNHTWGRIVGL